MLDLFGWTRVTLTGPALIPILARVLGVEGPQVEPVWFVYPDRKPKLLFGRLADKGYTLIPTTDYLQRYVHSGGKRPIIIFLKLDQRLITPFDNALFSMTGIDGETGFFHRIETIEGFLRNKIIDLNCAPVQLGTQIIRDFFHPRDNATNGWTFKVQGQPAYPKPQPAVVPEPLSTLGALVRLKQDLFELIIRKAASMTASQATVDHLGEILALAARSQLPVANFLSIRARLIDQARTQIEAMTEPSERVAAVEQVINWPGI